MKNQGISLITLIITIIVIIILAAIVIFTGLGTPDSANFATFCQNVDNVQSAVLNAYSELRTEHAIAGHTRNDEQIYMEIAVGERSPIGQYSYMSVATAPTGEASTTYAARDNSKATEAEACQKIVINSDGTAKSTYMKKLLLPTVREDRNAWYITRKGQVFNATGYVYKNGSTTSTYYTASVKSKNKKELGADDTYASDAKKIATQINNGSNDVTALDVN